MKREYILCCDYCVIKSIKKFIKQKPTLKETKLFYINKLKPHGKSFKNVINNLELSYGIKI